MFDLAQATGEAVVLLVAHNPGLQALAVTMAAGDARLARGFPPGALAVLERENGRWRLDLLHPPGASA